MMEILECLLLLGLIISALVAMCQRKPLLSVICFSVFGIVMSLLWMLLQAPDLAVTEAAVGTGVTGVLFYLTLRRVKQMKGTGDDK